MNSEDRTETVYLVFPESIEERDTHLLSNREFGEWVQK